MPRRLAASTTGALTDPPLLKTTDGWNCRRSAAARRYARQNRTGNAGDNRGKGIWSNGSSSFLRKAASSSRTEQTKCARASGRIRCTARHTATDGARCPPDPPPAKSTRNASLSCCSRTTGARREAGRGRVMVIMQTTSARAGGTRGGKGNRKNSTRRKR